MKAMLFRTAAAVALAAAMTSGALAKTMTYCSEGSPENFNPQINTTGPSLSAAHPVFNRLVEFERDSTKLKPGLAESWEISSDGLTYTFRLRKNAKFHARNDFKPTRGFTADDVIATFDRMWRKDHPYHQVSGGAYDYFNDMGFQTLLKAITKVDDHTLRVELTKPDATFLASLAMTFASIHSKEYMDAMLKAKTPEKVDQVPVGTGPFMFVDYKKDATIRYTVNPDYFNGKQPIDRLVYAITPDAAVRMARVQAGECLLAPYPSPADLPRLKGDAKLNVMEREGLNVGYLAFNTSKKPFDDKRVRHAVSMAIDRDAIVKAVFRGTGIVAANPIPPTIWAYNETLKPYPYDVEKAKALLKEAGVGELSVDLWAMPVQRPYNPDARKMAEMMQADLAKVGIKAEIKSYEWGEYRKRLQAGEHTLGQYGWIGDNGDPDNFMNVLLSCSTARQGGQNIARWCSKEYSDLVEQAKFITDMPKRTALYRKAQEVFHAEAPWLPIAHGIVYHVASKKVKNYQIHPLGTPIFEGVDIDE